MNAKLAKKSPARMLMRAPVVPVLLMAALVAGSVPALAQENADARLRKVEAEVRALQRKVFPGGDEKFFEPQITAPTTPTQVPGSQPSGTPLTDVLSRMDAVEAQMARLTGQVEQNSNRLAQMEARLDALPQPGAAPLSGTVEGPVAGPSSAQSNLNAMSGGAAAQPAKQVPIPAPIATPAPAKPAAPVAASDTRVAAVQAVVKPQTGDAGDDEYSYGFRLWDAGFYPEARQQLKLFLEKYPNHARGSWARNLLGRAWLDDKNPSEAAKWFLQNYQADKRGERAPDSLLYLAVSMKQMKDSKRACIALAEFSETYASEAAGRLNSLYTATRNGLTCS